MNIKQITVNGVTYEVPENNYTRIMEYLDNARVVESEKIAPQQEMATTAPVAVQKEQLTTASLKRLFGANYNDLCIYNFETGRLIKDTYKGERVYWSKGATDCTNLVKEYFSKRCTEFELVAQATRSVAECNYPGFGKWTDNNKNIKDVKGQCALGNLIIRNKKTGNLELVNINSWFGIFSYESSSRAAQRSISDLVFLGAKDRDYLEKLIANHANAVVVEKDETKAPIAQPVPVKHIQKEEQLTTVKRYKKEKLTTNALKRLFGANYKYVCVYDIEKERLLTKKYHGVELYWDEGDIKDTDACAILKDVFDEGSIAHELVGQVTMQVEKWDYPGFWKWGNAEFNKKGMYRVANLIIRDKRTGVLELCNNTCWFGAGQFHNNPAKYMACGLARYANIFEDFRASLCSGYCVQDTM